MPRAFLITHRRYNGTEEFDTPGRDYSPEHVVRVADYGGGQPTSDGVSDCGSETSSECPEELYNLTKLAEVSLAAAAGTLIHPSKVLSYQCALSQRWGHQVVDSYSPQLSIANPSRSSLQAFGNERTDDEDRTNQSEITLRERTRLFFERIETEREILEGRNRSSTPELPEVQTSRNASVFRCHLNEEEVCRLSDSLAAFPTDFITEQSLKSVAMGISRKGNSVSGSEESKSDDSEDHECPDCGKKYSTSSNLARHRQTHRSLGDKKARRCPHCDKIYVSMPAFSMHVRTHNQGCKCHFCGKCFSRPWLLQGHIRTHTGEKPFKCTICNKAFADKSNLRAHVQTHSNTKPHVCARCGKAFALKSYLYKHEESSCMRVHHRRNSDKRGGSNDPCGATASSSTNSTPGRVLTAPMNASPTSVIVARPGATLDSRTSPPVAVSTIIRHTENQVTATIAEDSSPLQKHQCQEKITFMSEESPKTEAGNKATEFLSRMVIRTSVISPNPKHLVRLGGVNGEKTTPFDFTNPTRASAFSKPTGISFNLAIA